MLIVSFFLIFYVIKMLAKDLLDSYNKNKQFISELVKIDNIVKKRNSSKLGYNWNIIFSLVTIIVLSLVFNKGFFKGDNYLLYLSLNFFLWQMISSILSNSISIVNQLSNSISTMYLGCKYGTFYFIFLLCPIQIDILFSNNFLLICLTYFFLKVR